MVFNFHVFRLPGTIVKQERVSDVSKILLPRNYNFILSIFFSTCLDSIYIYWLRAVEKNSDFNIADYFPKKKYIYSRFSLIGTPRDRSIWFR